MLQSLSVLPSTPPLDRVPPARAPFHDLRAALEAVAGSIAQWVGVETVAINLYRPAFHDFETVVVHGNPEARRLLLGVSEPAEEWEPVLDDRYVRCGAYFVPGGSFDWHAGFAVTFVPEIAKSGDPDAWCAEDALFVPLRSSSGALLGLLSVDEPHNGRRPTDADLERLVAVSAQAGLAIEAAQHAEASRRHRADVQQLLRVSSRLTMETSPLELAAATCEGIRDALAFERVAVALRAEDSDWFHIEASVGWPDGPPKVSWTESEMGPVLADDVLQEGCALLTREEAHRRTPPRLHSIYSSARNGRGPHGWDHHWLLVPLHDSDGRLIGAIWPDDPADRLLPTVERLRTLRAFANQAASALEAAHVRGQLAHLASHDPLTDLRNRRGLHAAVDEAIARSGHVACVVLDADGFKRINDELGHETGDAVLREVAAAIGESLPPDGIGARLGGEEFALVLPGTDVTGARLAAEALRRAAGSSDTVPWGLTLSAGLAVTDDDGISDADGLLRAAHRALFAAKRLGRDRVVVYDSVRLEPVIEALGRNDTRAAHHLSAVMLLAETLDLRDAGTARHSQTVGRYSEAIARRLDFRPDRVERVRIAGVLHDIGKLAVADAILHKPGKLTECEWAEVQRHSEVGARILSHAGLQDVSEWVLGHHERWDGHGYPNGLAGTDIPLEARIVSVADAYEAMTAVRPYRLEPLTEAAAQDELRRGAGTQFDAAVVRSFLAVLGAAG